MSVVAEIPTVPTFAEDGQLHLPPFVGKLVSKVLTQIIETEGYNSDVSTAIQNLSLMYAIEGMTLTFSQVWL